MSFATDAASFLANFDAGIGTTNIVGAGQGRFRFWKNSSGHLRHITIDPANNHNFHTQTADQLALVVLNGSRLPVSSAEPGDWARRVGATVVRPFAYSLSLKCLSTELGDFGTWFASFCVAGESLGAIPSTPVATSTVAYGGKVESAAATAKRLAQITDLEFFS